MSRLLIEGFEHGNANNTIFTTNNGIATMGSVKSGMTGAYWGVFNSGGAYGDLVLPINYSEIFIGLKLYCVLRSGNGPGFLCFYDSADTAIASLFMWYDVDHYHVRAMLGAQNSGNILATGSVVWAEGSTKLVRVQYKPLNSGGIFKVYVDSELDINFSGDSTAGLENIRKIRVGAAGVDNYQSGVDDIVIDDSELPGNSKIQKLQVSGAGTTGEWDASTGDPYACVDEIPPSDTDYISTNVPGELATFACSNLTGNVGNIKSVQIQARMLYEGNPAPNKQKIAVRSGGSEYYSGRFTPGVSAGVFRKIWQLNPADSQPWEEADVNALEIGVRAVQMTSTTTTSTTTTSA